MNTYREKFEIAAEGLSTRRLFWMLQESAGHHSTALGYSEQRMEELGVMWVVIRYVVNCERWPRPGETVTVETWPGQTRHGFCPRYYRFFGAEGEALLEASATWAVVDRESRKMVVPHERGVDIEAAEQPIRTGLGTPIRRPVTDRERRFVVPEEYLDVNGHMNNTTYFDLAESCLGVSARQRGLRQGRAEYINEALCGEEMSVRWGYDGEKYTVTGDADSGPVFRMQLTYEE